ncbi:MAG: hypothetical protein ACYDH9_07790 [Limisphaerales bacterium]
MRAARCIQQLEHSEIPDLPGGYSEASDRFPDSANHNISYFVGLGAGETLPELPPTDDRNLTTNGVPVGSGLVSLTTNLTLGSTRAMHDRTGNMVLGDGSVRLFPAVWRLNVSTNFRTLFP